MRGVRASRQFMHASVNVPTALGVSRPRRVRTMTLLCSAMIAVGVLPACGSSSGGSGASNTPAPSPVDTSLLGVDKPATGAAVKIGFLYDGQSAAIDTTNQVVAARAVVKYANAKLGGLSGRPIELVECETKSDPTNDCGNEFASQKVLAVVGGQTFSTRVLKQLAPHKIPYIDSNSAVFGDLNDSLTNPLLVLGAPVQYSKEHKITKVAMLVIDVAGSVGSIKAFAPQLFKKAGASLDVIGVPAGTPDLTPFVQAAETKKPGLYNIIGDVNFCTSALKAIKTLGIQTPISGINRCLSEKSAGSIPGGYAGFTAFSAFDLDPANSETKLYEAFRVAYAPKATDDTDLQTGYQALLGFIRGVNAVKPATLTSASIAMALKTMPETPLPLGGGLTFACNRKKVAVIPTACSTGAFQSDANADGSQKNFKILDDKSIYDISG